MEAFLCISWSLSFAFLSQVRHDKIWGIFSKGDKRHKIFESHVKYLIFFYQLLVRCDVKYQEREPRMHATATMILILIHHRVRYFRKERYLEQRYLMNIPANLMLVKGARIEYLKLSKYSKMLQMLIHVKIETLITMRSWSLREVVM